MFDLGDLWNRAGSGDGQIPADDILQLACSLKTSGAVFDRLGLTQPEPMIYIAPRQYNMIRWLHHLSKYRLPARKLRKCQLRRRAKRI